MSNKESKEIPKEVVKEIKRNTQFVKRDLSREFKYIPTNFIDDEEPLTFVFTLLSNSEQAELNDKLQYLQGDTVFTNHTKVDLETVKLKVHKVLNYLQKGKYITLSDIPLDFFEAEIQLEVASDLASYIRTLSSYGEELYD